MSLTLPTRQSVIDRLTKLRKELRDIGQDIDSWTVLEAQKAYQRTNAAEQSIQEALDWFKKVEEP